MGEFSATRFCRSAWRSLVRRATPGAWLLSLGVDLSALGVDRAAFVSVLPFSRGPCVGHAGAMRGLCVVEETPSPSRLPPPSRVADKRRPRVLLGVAGMGAQWRNGKF